MSIFSWASSLFSGTAPIPETAPATLAPVTHLIKPTIPQPVPASASVGTLWLLAEIKLDRLDEVRRTALRIISLQGIYAKVGLGIPWWFVGIIHDRECSGRWDQHLHNGDPLLARTTHVPAGRPLPPLEPPFGWLDSARDALIFERLAHLNDWSIEAALSRLEAYNGLGYQKRSLPSPYLWGATTAQQPGKFVADHQFDPRAWDQQVGCAAVMKWMQNAGTDLETA